LPSAGPVPELSIERTAERQARGAYLANNVYACMSCHSDRNSSLYAQPVIESTLGKGGYVWDEKHGIPGKVYAPNLTPYHLGEWTDGELFHAITAGISRDGRALFPLMPYHMYGGADREEIMDIIVYLRSLEPIAYDVPATELNFPMNWITKMIPQEPQFTLRPDASDPVALGKYLVNVASCYDCHTPMVKGRYDHSRPMAGGNEYLLIDGSKVRSANISPHKGSGIGGWSEEMFVKRFKMYADSSFVPAEVSPGDFNTEMPWNEYARMSEEEIRAIWAYLQTVEPIDNKVERFTPAP